jgi:hypothetical protein
MIAPYPPMITPSTGLAMRVFGWEVPFDEKLGFHRVKSPGTATCSRERICLFNEPSGVTFAMIQEKTA